MTEEIKAKNKIVGFPSPAEDFAENDLDLNSFLVSHKTATFFFRVAGNSMYKAGITNGDLLVVDRSLQPGDNAIVLAVLDGEFTVRRLKKRGKLLCLLTGDDSRGATRITEDTDFAVWGVVTSIIKKLV